MKIIQAKVEQFLYLVLLLIFIALGVGGFFLYKLLHDNQSIAKQNRSYSRCIATVFAQYTHDFVPVTITNLDRCTTESQTKATNNTPFSGTIPVSAPPSAPAKPSSASVAAPQPPSKVFVSSPSPNPAPKADNTQAEKPQPTPIPSLFQQILNATSDTFEMLNPFN